MAIENGLFDTLGIKKEDKKGIGILAKKLGVSSKKLQYFNEKGIIPNPSVISRIEEVKKVSEVELKLGMGLIDCKIIDSIQKNSTQIASIINQETKREKAKQTKAPKLKFETNRGKLYQGDCISLMSTMEEESIDLIFADPPFNLNKIYPSGMDDNIRESEYLKWSEEWLYQCCRLLKDGGSLFIWNLPKWNIPYGNFLTNYLNFKHWISVDIKFSLPINGRLYPSHYSLLYFTKGVEKNVFHPDRLPMEVCNKCYRELKDYGGYKNKMNPKGINPSDVWYDIPPVRHKKYMGREDANELSVKLLDRIIEMSSGEGDLVFDPFGGSGTTYITAEIKNRNWVGVELGTITPIVKRFGKITEEEKLIAKYRSKYNSLFPEPIKSRRKKNNIWTDDTYK